MNYEEVSESESEDLPDLEEVSDSDQETSQNPGKYKDWRSQNERVGIDTNDSFWSGESDDEGDETYDGLFSSLVMSFLDSRYSAEYPESPIDWSEDVLIFPSAMAGSVEEVGDLPLKVYSAYKRVAQKVHPVSGTFPEEARVRRSLPNNPLDSLPLLSPIPPRFIPTERLTMERMEELGVNHNNFLWPEEEKLFQQVIRLNEATLPYEEKDRGTLKQEYFSDYIMPIVPHTPWEYKNIPIPPGIRNKVIEMLKSKIEAGVYEPSQSSYRGRWFCVLKKNGSLRIVHDLQPLNKVSIRDASQLPIIDDFVESYGARQCYTVFDLFWGFDARIVDPRSRDMTAFYTPLGLLRLTALPMGYTNSPAEFQKCMTFILQDEIPDVANIFIDDLPIKGPATQYLDEHGNPETLTENPGIRRFIWEHAQDVHRIMHRIKCAGATFSPKKTQICRPEVVIVGQKCSAEGRSPDDDRIAKILKWPPLTTVKEVRGFLGLCGTVRIWIKDFSQIARPLVQLTRKDAEFEWTDECLTSFNRLKHLVTTAPVLHPIDYQSERPVILSVDTSYIAVGFILSQIDENGKRRPARYGSIPLHAVHQGYSQSKLELYGLFRALTAWKIYLVGAPNLIVEMDASYVKNMINNPDMQPNNALNRWIQGILLHDFKLNHVPATQFRGPDALSRRQPAKDETVEPYDDLWLEDIALLLTTPSHFESHRFDFHTATQLPYSVYVLPSNTPQLSRPDQMLADIKRFLETLEIPPGKSLQARKHFLRKSLQFFLKDRRMYKRNGLLAPLRVITNPQKRIAILTQAHENLGHKGEQAVFELVRLRFFWPHLRTDVHHHVSSCHECQIRNTKRMEVPVTISTPSTLFQKIYVDVMYMPPHGSYHYIVAAKDDLTGITEARALQSIGSESLANFFRDQIYYRYGAVAQVTTDNGPEVQGAFDRLVKHLGIPQVRISPYNKHANGVVERGHYILREAIVKSCKKDSDGKALNWPSQVLPAVFADRVTVSSVTGYSPYFLLHGLHPLLPFDLFEATFLVEGFHSGMETSDLLALRIRQLHKHESDLERASQVLRIARLRSKEQFIRRYAKRLQRSEYPEGSLVLVRNNRHEDTLNKFKLHPRYLGPYEVVRRTARGSYTLKELDGTLHQQQYAAFRLITYINRNDPILWETSDNGEEEEFNDDNHDGDHEMLYQQEGSDTSEEEFDLRDLHADSGDGSDGSNSCLALIMDPASKEVSSTDCDKKDLPDLYMTQMDSSDIILALLPEQVKQALAHAGSHTDRVADHYGESHRIWICLADLINTIRFMAIIKESNDVRQISDRSCSNSERFMIAGNGYRIEQFYELRIAVWINTLGEETMRPTPRLIHELSWVELIRII